MLLLELPVNYHKEECEMSIQTDGECVNRESYHQYEESSSTLSLRLHHSINHIKSVVRYCSLFRSVNNFHSNYMNKVV